MKKICIVGSGAAGLLVLYNLEKQGIDPTRITIIDPTHNGGDMQQKWLNVRSNTTWRQVFGAVPSRTSFAIPFANFPPDEPLQLKHVIQYLTECTKDYKEKTFLRTDKVKNALYENGSWRLFLEKKQTPVTADVVFFCQGSDPKSLDLPYPSIPLEIALDERRLSDFVTSGQHVLLFGTAHSSALIVKNLTNLGARVTNFYATEEPFYFASDGHYDGIKFDAATIARDILNGAFPSVTLESVHDMAALIRASKSADSCIYACGFEPRVIQPGWKKYDGNTGRIEDTTNAWGFGIAYPNKAPNGIHWDVSVPSFQSHIQAQMPDILATLQ